METQRVGERERVKALAFSLFPIFWWWGWFNQQWWWWWRDCKSFGWYCSTKLKQV